jgi:hypothetical protein
MVAWSLLIIAGLAAIAGLRPIFDLYNKFWWYDETVHFFSYFSGVRGAAALGHPPGAGLQLAGDHEPSE